MLSLVTALAEVAEAAAAAGAAAVAEVAAVAAVAITRPRRATCTRMRLMTRWWVAYQMLLPSTVAMYSMTPR